MTIIAIGKQTSALPAPGSAAYLGLVHEIQIAPDPSATGYVSIKQGANVMRTFNKPATAGANDSVYCIKAGSDHNGIDPTQLAISQTVAGEGAFVTYFIL